MAAPFARRLGSGKSYAFQQQDLITGELKVAIFRLGWQVTRFGKVRTMAVSLLSGIGVVRMLKRWP